MNGIINLTSSASDFEGRINWSSNFDKTLAKSTLTLSYQVRRINQINLTGGNASGYTVKATLALVDAMAASGTSINYTTPSNLFVSNSGEWVTITSTTHTVYNSKIDGQAIITVACDITGTVNNISFTVDDTLIELDRAVIKPVIDEAPNFTNVDNPIIYYTNAMGEAATSLKACISFDGSVADIPYRDIDKNGGSYQFELTSQERETLISGTSGNSRTVRFIIRMVYDGEIYYTVAQRTFTKTNLTPTLSPTVVDVNTTTVALTGDANTIIRGHNTTQFAFNASGKEGATIVKYEVTCGAFRSTSSTGAFDNVDSNVFVFTVTDSRGAVATKVVVLNMIEYVKITCNQNVKMLIDSETEAQIELTISGNFFNESFGAKDNTVALYVRHSQNDGTMGDWADLSPLLYSTDGNTYTLTTSISGFDPSGTYTFQSKAIDALGEAVTGEYAVKFYPVFDWDKNDFNFNVPINMNGQTVLRHNTSANNVVLSASGGFIYLRQGGTNYTATEVKITPQGNIELTGDIIINGQSLKSLLGID